MASIERAIAPAVAKTLQPNAYLTHRQTAIVRTVIDEMERCEHSIEVAHQLNLQMIDELRRLARRVLDVADALEREGSSCEADVPSGVRLRASF